MLALSAPARSLCLALPFMWGASAHPLTTHEPYAGELARLRLELTTSHQPAPLHLAIASFERRSGRLERAREALKLAERSGADVALVKDQLSACAEMEGDFKEAEYLLDELVLVRPKDQRLLRRRAAVRDRLGKHLAAACDLAAARNAEGAVFSVEDELRLAETLVTGGYMEAASAALGRALDGAGADAVLLQRAIEIDTQLGEWDRAGRRCAALEDRGVAAHVVARMRGDLRLAMGDIEGARIHWRQAAGHIRRVHGRRAKAGAFARALKELDTRLALSPSQKSQGGE